MPVVTCYCGFDFHIAPSHLKRLKHEPTCSQKCRGLAMTGKNHWNWKTGQFAKVEAPPVPVPTRRNRRRRLRRALAGNVRKQAQKRT